MIFVVVVRFALMPIYLQSYLNLAHDKIMDLRKEAGRITNVEFKQKVEAVFILYKRSSSKSSFPFYRSRLFSTIYVL